MLKKTVLPERELMLSEWKIARVGSLADKLPVDKDVGLVGNRSYFDRKFLQICVGQIQIKDRALLADKNFAFVTNVANELISGADLFWSAQLDDIFSVRHVDRFPKNDFAELCRLGPKRLFGVITFEINFGVARKCLHLNGADRPLKENRDDRRVGVDREPHRHNSCVAKLFERKQSLRRVVFADFELHVHFERRLPEVFAVESYLGLKRA